MASRPILALQSQLMLPLIPFAVDTFARMLFDWNIAHHLYELPDPVMFLTTYAFFCVGCMFLISGERLPPSDTEFADAHEVARRNLLIHAIVFISLAVLVSVMRAIDAEYPKDAIYASHLPIVLIVSTALVVLSFAKIYRAELTYVAGG